MFDFSSLFNFLPDYLQQQAPMQMAGAAVDKPMFLSPEAMAGAPNQAMASSNPITDLFSGKNAETLRKQLIMQALMGGQNKQQPVAPAPAAPPPMPMGGGGMPNRFAQQSPAPMVPGLPMPRRYLGQG